MRSVYAPPRGRQGLAGSPPKVARGLGPKEAEQRRLVPQWRNLLTPLPAVDGRAPDAEEIPDLRLAEAELEPSLAQPVAE